MNIVQVEGTDKGPVFLYALSTCGWCKATKQMLNDLGVAYQYLDVNLLPPAEKTQVLHEIKPWDPSRSSQPWWSVRSTWSAFCRRRPVSCSNRES